MKASSSITISHITDGLTTHYEYAKNESNITAPSVGWSPTVPASEVGKFIWRREGQALAGDTPSTWSTPVCLTGVDGIGILEVVEYYALSDVSTEVNILSNTDFSGGKTGWTSQKETWDITGGIATLHNGGSIYQGLTSEYLPKQTVTVVVKVKGTGKLIVRWGGTTSSGVDVTQDWDIYHTTLTVAGNNNLIIESSVDGVLEIDWIKAVENITATNYWVPNVPATITEWQEEPMTPTAELPFLWNYEKIFYTDGSFEETLRRIIGVHGDKGLPGSKGEPGADYGESAPYVYAEGNTIYVEGGYFYYNQVKVEVPNFSLALTGTGGGYVLASDSEVVIAKMLPEQGYVKWAHYNTLENVSGLFIIGRFDRGGGGITNINQVSPIHPSQFTKSHFMELLADGGYADMTVWADALGVTQVFESLAVWDLFANKLNVNTLEIEKMVAGKLFRLLLTASEGANYPLVEAYRGSELVFQINAEDGSVFINGTGNFSGTIKHEALETSAYAAGSPISLTPTASLWSGASLYNSLSEGGVKSATGTGVNGKSVNCYAKLTNPAYVQCGSNTDRFQVGASWVSKSHSIPLLTTIVDFQLSVPKLPQAPPISFEIYKTSGGVETKLKSGAIPQGSSITFSFEYKYGDSVRIACRGAVGFSLSLIYVLTYRTSASYTKGILIGYTDNTVTHVKHDGYYDHPIILTSPSWNYGSYISYRKGDPLSSHSVVTALSIGLVFPATGSATIYPAGGSSTTYTVIGIRRDSNGTSLVTTVGEVSILKWGGNGTAIGVFNSYTVSISMVGQQRAIMVSSMLPKSNGDGKDLHTVGSSSSKFLTGYFVTLYSDLIGNVTGQVNDAGTSNKVYGAVFN